MPFLVFKRLDRREQEVFLVIYTLEEEKGSLTYEDIARKLSISEQLASNYVTSLIEKGVPIMKRYINSKPYLKLDPEFKTLQTKENILQLSLAIAPAIITGFIIKHITLPWEKQKHW